MKQAYQVYDVESGVVEATDEVGYQQFKAHCSECGCPVYSDKFPSERTECPHCHAEFSSDRMMRYKAWVAQLNHVGYTPRECGREQ